MKKVKVSDNKKKIGRPATGVGTLVGQRWRDDQLDMIEDWRRSQRDMPSRAEAIRRLVELGLTVKQPKPQSAEQDRKDRAHKIASETVDRAVADQDRKARAKELAGHAIDRMTDAGASDEDNASRRRRLIKGPEEFRAERVDRKKKS